MTDVYTSTHYIVLLGSTPLIRRVRHQDADADRRLRTEAGVMRNWAIVTPCNPHSTKVSNAENRHRLKRLRERLNIAGLRWIEAVNRDPGGHWPDEPGFLVGDAGLEAARALAAGSDQLAFVFAELGGAPGLVWTA